MEEDDRPKKKKPHEIGQDLTLLSVEELAERIAVLKDEIARLKGLPPRPTIKPPKPSGMEKATGAKAGTGKRRRRGAKRDGDRVSREVTVAANAPAGSRFKGYETVLVRDLVMAAEVVRYRRQRWVTPTGETIMAPLPAGIIGGWGPNLRRFILACHIQGQVTTERLTALLTGIGDTPPRSAMTASPYSAPEPRSLARRSWRRCAPGTAITSSMTRHWSICAAATSPVR